MFVCNQHKISHVRETVSGQMQARDNVSPLQKSINATASDRGIKNRQRALLLRNHKTIFRFSLHAYAAAPGEPIRSARQKAVHTTSSHSAISARRSRKCSFNIRLKNAEQRAGIPGMRQRRIEAPSEVDQSTGVNGAVARRSR